ncbi:hypothetical protein [Spirillospora sp. NBC_01491]|uniref:hypothetical protein n=1 Tax=Spirillospora sp. NBC_01491 TaxID=2976007 RepID=UPI002E342B43|nr:hypothetical protein [Spirillospora sp. NBC_01491]
MPLSLQNRRLKRIPVGRAVKNNVLFSIVLFAGVLLRVVTVLGYPPALWFNDSYDYVRLGNSPFPNPLRSEGYGIMLWLLRPFHSLAFVVTLQHLMIVAVAVLGYRVLVRDFAVRRGWAALAVAPLLLDGFQIELEHMLLSDALFTALLLVAVLLMVRPGSSSLRRAGMVGGLLGVAAVTRTVGVPIIVIAVLFLLLRRTKWTAVAVLAVAFAVPVGGYAVWFQQEHGRLALTGADGIFLWGRTTTFVDCSKKLPPGDLMYMCPAGRPGTRGAASHQIWVEGSPTGWRDGYAFSPEMNDRAQRFALWAIAQQPGDYVQAVAYDFFIRTFSWDRTGHPTPATAAKYRFPKRPDRQKDLPVIGGGDRSSVVREYEHGSAATRIVEPFAGFMRGYQTYVNVRGTLLGIVLLFASAGIVLRRARPESAVFWLVGVALLTVPPVTTDFDYRYVLPAMPFLFLSAATAWNRDRGGTADGSEAPRSTERKPEPVRV